MALAPRRRVSSRRLRKRRDEAAEIERISRETLPLLEEIRDHVDDQPRVNRAIAPIDALRAQMNDARAVLRPDHPAHADDGAQAVRGRPEDLRRRSSTPIEKQRRQVDRDIDNVRGVAEAAGEFQQLMRRGRSTGLEPHAPSDGRPREHARPRRATPHERTSPPCCRCCTSRPTATARRGCSAGGRCCAGRSTGSSRVAARDVGRDRLLGRPARRRRCRSPRSSGPTCSPRARASASPEIEAVAASRRWADGWRGGLLGTCDFDLGFHAGWFDEVAAKLESDAVAARRPGRRAGRPGPGRRPDRPRRRAARTSSCASCPPPRA